MGAPSRLRGIGLAAALFFPFSRPPQEPVTVDLGGESLTLALPDLEARTPGERTDEQLRGLWAGKRGGSVVWIEVRYYPREKFRFEEPEAVVELIERNYADPKRAGDPGWSFDTTRLVEGKFGRVPYAALSFRAGRKVGAGVPEGPSRLRLEADAFVLGGILEKGAYSVEVLASPPLAGVERAGLVDFLSKGVSARTPERDPAWTEAEVRERWNRDVPASVVRDRLEKPLRTEHFVILTNSSGGALFGKKMEEFYDIVRKVYPFPERKGERLLPVFLFRTRDQYVSFYSHATGASKEAAERSKGFAWRDYYATYYEAPNDPTHLHEATHQIFRNRLRLAGGGSWFQEGVAEYVSSNANERRSVAKRLAKSGKFIPFRTFLGLPSLIDNPHLDAESSYLQAASVIDFLQNGKFQPENFRRFLEEVGGLPRGKVERIEEAVRAVYGVGIDGLEKAWVEYWRRL